MSRVVTFRPSAASSSDAASSSSAALAAAFQSNLSGGAGASGHAAEEDTAFLAESSALLRSATGQLREPLFVPLQFIVDLRKANEEVRRHRMAQIQQNFDDVSRTLRSYVHRHYDSFNDSIDYFSQLIRRISDAQHTVAASHVDLSNVQGMLQCRALELEAHFRRAARSILIKRMLRSAVDCAQAEGRVQELLQRQRFIAAAETVARTREVLAKPHLRGVQSLARLVNFANSAADHIKRSAFDFLLGTVFLRGELESRATMLTAIRRSGGRGGAGGDSLSYLAHVSRDAPLFDAVKQAVGAFRHLGALQDVPKLLCGAATACLETYFTAFVAAYAVYVREDFSAEQVLQSRNAASNSHAGAAGPSAGISLSATPTAASLLSGSSHLLTEERRQLAAAQRPAVAAFFQRVLRQAAVMLQNLQRVVDIVLEEELPFFRSSRAASEVWKALIAAAWSADSWNVEECSFAGSPVIAQRIMMQAIARIREDASRIGGEVAATVDTAFGATTESTLPSPPSAGAAAASRQQQQQQAVLLPQWISAATNDPAYTTFGALLRGLLGTTRAMCEEAAPATQNAVQGLVREHIVTAARATVAQELRRLGAAWDLTPVWDAMQRLFITMARVLCGVPASKSAKEDEAERAQQQLEMLGWSKAGGGRDDGGGDGAAGGAAGSTMLHDEGRIGLEKLSYLLTRRDRGTGLPKFLDDFGIVQVRLSLSADNLIRGDVMTGASSSSSAGSKHSNAVAASSFLLPLSSPGVGGASKPSGGYPQAQQEYVFPKVASSMETALNNTIVPVAGNARTVWMSLEPFVGVVQSVLCLGKASVAAMFSDLGTVMSRQLLTQAHNFWMQRVAAVMVDEQKRASSSITAAAVEPSSAQNNNNNNNNNSNNNNIGNNGVTNPMALVAATSTTQETVGSIRPVLEVVDCSMRGVHLDFGPMAQRGMAHGGLSHDLALAVAERLAVLLESVVAAAGKKLWQVCGGSVSARAFAHHQSNRGSGVCWSDLISSTLDTPLAVLAGAPDLWEASLQDLRESTQADIPSAPSAQLFLPLDGVAFVATTAYSFELLAETVDALVVSPILASPAINRKQAQLQKLGAIVEQCRCLFRDALTALAAHVLGIVLHKAAEMRNDAVFSATICSQRPSLFASELCNDLQNTFSVLSAHLSPPRCLWLASMLAAPTAQLLLDNAVQVRNKRFTSAGVDQLVYDTLALQSTVEALVVRPIATAGAGGGSAASAAAPPPSSSSFAGGARGGAPSSSTAAAGGDDVATFLEMVSKLFRRPLDFFRLLRRSNDAERAGIVQDIITHRLHQRFSQQELETLVELVMHGHKGAESSPQLVQQHVQRLRAFIDSTYHHRSIGSIRDGEKSDGNDPSLKLMLSRAAALFGTTVEMNAAAATATATATATGSKVAAATATATGSKDKAAAAAAAAAPPTAAATAGDTEEEEEEDEEEEVEEEEEEEEEDEKSKTQSAKSDLAARTQKTGATAAGAASPSAATSFSGGAATPKTVMPAASPAPVPPPSSARPSVAASSALAAAAKEDSLQGGASDADEDEEEFEEFEEEESEEEEDGTPPPPPTSAPPPPPPPATANPHLSLRDKLQARARR